MEQLNEVLKNSNAALLKESNYLAAIGMLNDAIESFPNFAALYLNRGCLFAKYDTTEQATLDFAKVLELDPTDYLSYFNLFTLHYKLGNFPLAYDMLCCCISNSYLRRGIISNHQGDLTKALKFCQNNLWVFVGKTVLNFI